MPIVAPAGVVVVGLAILVPGLGSFGLWEPPATWRLRYDRQSTTSTGRARKLRVARSELLLADEARESLLVVKTKASMLPEVTKLVKEMHSNEVPEIIALPITGGNEDYLRWLGESVG